MYAPLAMEEAAARETGSPNSARFPTEGTFSGTLLQRYAFFGCRRFSSSTGKSLINASGKETLELSFYEEGLMISLSESTSQRRQERTCVDECFSLGCGWACCCCEASEAFTTATADFGWHFVQRNALRDVHVACHEIQIGRHRQFQAVIGLHLFVDISSNNAQVPCHFKVALEPAVAADFFAFAQMYLLRRTWNAQKVSNHLCVLALQAGATVPVVQMVEKSDTE